MKDTRNTQNYDITHIHKILTLSNGGLMKALFIFKLFKHIKKLITCGVNSIFR